MSSTLAPSASNISASRPRQGLAIDSLLLSGVFGLLFFAPLAFGATDNWSIFVLEMGTILLFALWVWRKGINEEWRVRDNPVAEGPR